MSVRVLHLISSAGLYGAERVLLSLLDNLDGVEASLCVFDKPGAAPLIAQAETLGVEIHKLPDSYGQLFRGVRQLRDLCQSKNIQILQSHGYKENVIGGLALARNRDARLLITQHGYTDKNIKSRLFGKLDRLFARAPWVVAIVCASSRVEQLYRDAGVPATKLVRLRNGVAVTNAAPDAGKTLDEPAYDLVFLGRLSFEKGIDILLRALASVGPANPSLLLAGDGPERGRLSALASDLGIADQVTFTGYTDDPTAALKAGRVFVLPSRTEGLPMALLEALALGKPAIASAVGDIPDVFAKGEVGRLVPPGDLVALTNAIEAALSDRFAWEKMGAAGRRVIEADYNHKALRQNWINLYKRCLGSGGGQ